jgi:hypothetical protein
MKKSGCVRFNPIKKEEIKRREHDMDISIQRMKQREKQMVVGIRGPLDLQP